MIIAVIMYYLCWFSPVAVLQPVVSGQHVPTGRDSLYINVILQSSRDNSYYLALDVEAPDYQGRVVIENLMLYRFLHSTRAMSWSEYRDFMRDILLRKVPLRTETELFASGQDSHSTRWNFYRVESHDEVARYARQGKEQFLEHFFAVQELIGTMKDTVYSLDQASRSVLSTAVINQLFEWNIYVCRQGYTGALIFLTDKRSREIEQQYRAE